MKLNLAKDIVILDVETTGLSVSKSKIIQIAILKVFADGRPNELKCRLVNPEEPIPAKITEITGITDEMVKNEPTFDRLAKGLLSFIGEKTDICGFNSNRFDIPIILESFNRCGIEFDMSGRSCVDVKRIFHKFEKRRLQDAHEKYVGRPMENAHDAGADVQATLDVLESMLDFYKNIDYIDDDGTIIKSPLVNDIDALHEFTKNFGELDYEGWIKQNEQGKIVFGKGKYQEQEICPVLAEDPKYRKWLLETGEFTRDTRKKFKILWTEHEKQIAKEREENPI